MQRGRRRLRACAWLAALLVAAPMLAGSPAPPTAGDSASAEADYRTGLAAIHGGHGVHRDLVTAARALGRAADQGHAQARAQLDKLLAGAYARPNDVRAMAAVYRERAAAGDAVACTKLGLMYRDGIGVHADDAQALAWLRRGAEKGDREGEAALGSMYDEGRGVPRDRAIAASWFRKAAERGHAGAQFSLGSMVVQGDGIPKDVPEGLMWLELARKQDRSARYLLFRLEEELDPAELHEGRQRADAWRAAHGAAPATAPEPTPAAPQPEPL